MGPVIEVLAQTGTPADGGFAWTDLAANSPTAALVLILAGVGKWYLDRAVAKPNGGNSLRDHVDANNARIAELQDQQADMHANLAKERAAGDSKLHERIDKVKDDLSDIKATVARIEGRQLGGSRQ